MPARTIEVAQTENDCPICVGEGVVPPFKMTAQMDTDSTGIGQRLSCFCSKHGPVKCLYNFPVDPVNKKLFIELFENEFGPMAPEPKPTSWV